MSDRVFCCHASSIDDPATCAGFLLRGADHNMMIRLAYIKGEIGDDLTDAGHPLFQSYKEMAVANGVDLEDPVLDDCRD